MSLFSPLDATTIAQQAAAPSSRLHQGFIPSLPRILDATMLSIYHRCPQKFYLEFCRGARKGSGTSLDLFAGQLFAWGIENVGRLVWEQGMALNAAVDRTEVEFLHRWSQSEWTYDKIPASSAKTPDRMMAALRRYFAQFPPHDDLVHPVMTDGRASYEYNFAIPLDDPSFPRHPTTGEPFLYTGRFDRLGRHTQTGRLVIQDEKTSKAAPAFNWSSRWQFRWQFLGYVWACQHQGMDVNTVLVRGITIQKTSEPPVIEAYLTFNKSMIDRWYVELRRRVTSIVTSWQAHQSGLAQPFSYAMGDACTDFGGCPFLDICTTGDENYLFDNFSEVRWNPLANHDD